MRLAIAHLQQQIRVLEKKLEDETNAHMQEQRAADARKASVESLKATLAEFKEAAIVLQKPRLVETAPAAEVAPAEKKKRA